MRWLALSLLCAACSRQPGEGVVIEDAVAQVFPSGLGTVSFVVQNRSRADEWLRAVRCPIAEDARLHVVELEGEVARMREAPEGLVVPGHGSLRLHPGGPHLMLYGVRAGVPLVPLTLQFDRAGAVEVTAAVVTSQADRDR